MVDGYNTHIALRIGELNKGVMAHHRMSYLIIQSQKKVLTSFILIENITLKLNKIILKFLDADYSMSINKKHVFLLGFRNNSLYFLYTTKTQKNDNTYCQRYTVTLLLLLTTYYLRIYKNILIVNIYSEVNISTYCGLLNCMHILRKWGIQIC